MTHPTSPPADPRSAASTAADVPNAAAAVLPDCCTLWIGPRLETVERACLTSVLRQGHRVTLYCYDPIADVPDGIVVADATEILPKESIIRYPGGSVAVFSDRFRYELQRRSLGIWIDCDLYLIAPLHGDAPYVMGEYRPGEINNAVLRLPPDSPLLTDLLALFDERCVPPWLHWRAKIAAHWRLRRSGRTGAALMPWGMTGPNAISALAAKHGVASLALPSEVFYPRHWEEADWIVNPAIHLEDVITAQTVAVHMWNEMIKPYKDRPAPTGSFLARLQAEGAS